jgi:hypothetical protein
MLNEIASDEATNKKPNRYSSDQTKVQRCKQPKFERQALLAQNPMLAAVLIWS